VILVVEDDAPLARLMEALLDSAGYRVISVGDGESALASVHSNRPDLMLLDLTLPKLDGWEVLDRLQTTEHAPPVILFTGHHAAGDRALQAGAAAAILKPFDVDDLLDTVERLLVDGTG
jgi:DNA-binding response OmpR family regulator